MNERPKRDRGGYIDALTPGIARRPSRPLAGPEDDAVSVTPSQPQSLKGSKPHRTKSHVSVYLSPETEKKFDRLCYEYFSRYEEKINRQDIVRTLLDSADESVLARVFQKKQSEQQQKNFGK